MGPENTQINNFCPILWKIRILWPSGTRSGKVVIKKKQRQNKKKLNNRNKNKNKMINRKNDPIYN